ncbi:Lysozyme RrrD [Paraburkholderia hiiakae]|uniref:Lysozyme n=1 Tax=Paraburkholderia hiiakae TaxID=1081782 RepID=A0ABM8P5C9_9BURK|nr:lysozyme [Paraburkholderia hiiakae]CAD6556744.1 Lysozyme RrrD [Paraburkholderia hiiakae]
MATPRPVGPDAVTLIKQYEGIPLRDNVAYPYLDPIGIWTIGWGHAITAQGRFLRGQPDLSRAKALYPDGITLDQAGTLLDGDLIDIGSEVLALVTVPLNENQYGALTSFTFNLGSRNLQSSTLLKVLNGGDYSSAANQFARWCYAGGKLMSGLLERRNAERALFQKTP